MNGSSRRGLIVPVIQQAIKPNNQLRESPYQGTRELRLAMRARTAIGPLFARLQLVIPNWPAIIRQSYLIRAPS